MKKIGLILFALYAISQYGCKRTCIECNYQWELANGQKIYTPQPEFCGNEEDIEAYKEDETKKAIQLANKVGGKNVTLHCVEQR